MNGVEAENGETVTRRLLLLVTTRTYRAGAFIAATRALGVELTVGSERAQVLASHNPDGHLVLDLGATDRALSRILDFARQHPIHAVIGADDECALLAARATAALGLAGHPPAAVRTARDKLRAREAFAAARLHSPPFAVLPLGALPEGFEKGSPVSELPQAVRQVGFPCVIKPRGLAASRGVIRADNPREFASAFARIRRMLREEPPAGADDPPFDSILAERFIPGHEVALEGLMSNGSLRVLALFDKPDPLDGPYFEETIYVTPSRVPAERQGEIAETAARAARALGLTHGPIHAEFRVNSEGIWPLEIAPRSIGGLCSRAVRFEGGDSLEAILLRHALGDPAEFQLERLASGVMMIPIPRAGRLRAVRGLDEARKVPGVVELSLTRPIGSDLVPLPEGAQYLGFLFARRDRPDEAERSLREAYGRLSFDIEEPAESGEETIET